MPRPLGTFHAALEDKPLTRKFVARFGVMDFHSHFRWHAIKPYIDWTAERTLEVGANSGVMTFELADLMPDGQIISSEFDSAKVAEAQYIKRTLGFKNVSVGQADLRELSLAGQEFDQALVIDVLEHIRDHETAVRQLAAAMRVGGRLVVSVPTPNYPEIFGRTFHENIGHVRDGYWLEDARALLEGNGFRILDSRYYTGRLASLGCSLYYREPNSYQRHIPKKLRAAATPAWRWVGMLGERNVRPSSAASLAVKAVRV